MKGLIRRTFAGAAIAALAAGTAGAQLNSPVPTNATLTFGGLEWAWANPLPAASGLNLTYQGTLGWRIPTAAELTNAPLATQFIYAGANVPLGGIDPVSSARFQATNSNLTGAAACAAPYFSQFYVHCDWQDGLGQVYGPWAGMPGEFGFADQLVVRNAVSAVPEPATIALVGGGLLALAGVARRRRTV